MHRAGSYVKRLDLDDNNFMDRMSGDPHRQQYLENEKKREKLRVLAGRPMIAGQSEELRKKAQLSGVPSMLSPGARASGYFGGSRMSLPCTSLDIGEVTSEMVLSKKQEHHQRLLQQIQYERAQKMNQKIKKLEDDKRERNTIEERNSLYSRKLQEIDSGKKEEMKAFINKQRREKVQQEIERVMTKTRLGIAAKQQARKMEENEKEALNTKKVSETVRLGSEDENRRYIEGADATEIAAQRYEEECGASGDVSSEEVQILTSFFSLIYIKPQALLINLYTL